MQKDSAHPGGVSSFMQVFLLCGLSNPAISLSMEAVINLKLLFLIYSCSIVLPFRPALNNLILSSQVSNIFLLISFIKYSHHAHYLHVHHNYDYNIDGLIVFDNRYHNKYDNK